MCVLRPFSKKMKNNNRALLVNVVHMKQYKKMAQDKFSGGMARKNHKKKGQITNPMACGVGCLTSCR